MERLLEVAAFLAPWEISPTAVALTVGVVVLYWRGLRRPTAQQQPSWPRRIAFFMGVALTYFVMQTRYDFLSQHMFFIHRLQHLVLHHLGPDLIVLAQPLAVLANGSPAWLSRVVRTVWNLPPARFCYRILQNFIVAPFLFAGLVVFWLTSRVHFDAMISTPLYWVMNWSMLLDGLLFWALLLDPRTREEGALLGFGPRIFIGLAAMVPQILIGAYITFVNHDLYEVYDICGRAWEVDPLIDQRIGGLITWIPSAMMHVVAALILIHWWAHSDRNAGAPRPVPSSSPAR